MRKTASIVGIVFGAIFVIAGIVTWIVITNTLSDQKITVSDDAGCRAGATVAGPISAYCQASVIDKHTMEITGGKTYAELERDDPNRDTAMTSSFLQASLSHLGGRLRCCGNGHSHRHRLRAVRTRAARAAARCRARRNGLVIAPVSSSRVEPGGAVVEVKAASVPLTAHLIDALVVDPRPPHRDRTGRRGHLPLGVMTVADHQPTAIGVDLPSMGLDMGGDLGLQRGRQHLPGTITDNLIQQRRAGLVGLRTFLDYREHEGYLSEPARQRRLLIENHRLQIILGKVRSFTSPGREPSTSSDHCSQGTPEDATADNAVEAEGGQRREDLVEVDLAAAYLHVLAHPAVAEPAWHTRSERPYPPKQWAPCAASVFL